MDNKQRKLEQLMAQPYYVILKRQNNKFYLHIPELSLIVEDGDLNKAYEKLESGKRNYFQKMIELDAAADCEPPAGMNIRAKRDLLAAFGPFMVKVLILVIIGFVFLNLSAAVVKYASFEIKGIPYEIVNKINAMPQEEIERRKMLIRNAVIKMKPFIDEVKVLFEDNKREGAQKE